MPDYLTPGVYVEEVELGPPPITGVSTSIAGFVGAAQMGPTKGGPTLVTSYADFERTFGGFLPEAVDPDDTSTFLAYAVNGFFQNGGQILYVSRVVGASAAPSWVTLFDSAVEAGVTYFLTRPAQQMPATKDSIALVSARFVSAGTVLTLVEPTDAGSVREQATVLSVSGDTVTFAPTANRFTTAAVVEIPAPGGFTSQPSLTITAANEGTWGQNVRLTATPSSRTSAQVLPIDVHTALAPMTIALALSAVMPDVTHAPLTDVSLVRPGDQLRFADGATPAGETATVDSVDGGTSTVVLQAPGVSHTYDPGAGGTVALVAEPGLRVAADTTDVTVAVASAAGFETGQAVQIEDGGGNVPGTVAGVAGANVHLTLGAPFSHLRTIPAGATLRLEDAAVGDQLRLTGAANLAAGDVVELTDSAWARSYATVQSVNGDVVTFTSAVPASIAAGDTVRTADFDLLVELTQVNSSTGAIEVVTSETYTFLTVADGSPNNAVARINERSTLVVASRPAGANDAPEGFPTTIDQDAFTWSKFLGGGNPGATLTADDYIADPGAGPGERKGIQCLQDVDEISIVAAPGFADPNVHAALIEQCESLKYRFAVIEAPRGSTIPKVEAYRNQFDTKYAAIYFPWLTINDPLTGLPRTAPPSGHVIGVYANVDNTRGVHKAPANEVVSGITGLELNLTNGEQGVLNEPRNINVIRDFRSRQYGIRIWGARCVTSATDWKYVNVRRLFIYLEHSLDKGTQWVVFEPNAEPLWARARQSVSSFLTRVWRDGALVGAKAEQAFFVTCDRTTMTQDDIDNGRLIMLIGVAPVKPAEFVIIRIGQQVGGAAVSES
jgi:phage tail sheath protein FI